MSDAVERLTSALADRYAIERELGAGGMATVYLAHDVRHDRKVALKLLRPELSAILGAERFLHEIKTTANLQHPHILSLFDSGEADGLVYYVMPYVDGESLRDRLTREKQLPVEDAVRIAREVADALEYAHTQGVVHRDIKPENILLHGGHAMVADFGIALAASRSEGAARMTETGMSLGTPAYMAPEQAMGERDITPRADVYALGAVLYEMLSGEPPFVGPTAQAIIARVMTEEPRALTLHRHTIPPHVEAAVRKALEKLPADRFATAAAFAEALGNPTFGTSAAAVAPVQSAPPSGWRARLRDPATLTLVAVSVVLAVLAARLARRPEAAVSPAIRFAVAGTDSGPIIPIPFPWPAAISPDGGTLVYAVAQHGGFLLYARRSDQLEGHPIAGTENANQALFSPDGRWVAFEVADKEKKVQLDGSAPVTIATGGGRNGADWSMRDELIVGATGSHHGLSRVSVFGGELVQFTRPDSAHGQLEHDWPIGAPDGRHVVFTVWTNALTSAQLAITSVEDGAVKLLGVSGIRPLAVLDGMLVYLQADGAVMAIPLDVGAGRVTGRPTPVLDPVRVDPSQNGNSGIFVSRGGALVTEGGAHRSRLAWQSRDGKLHFVSADGRDMREPRISPDGRRIAVLVADGSKADVWILELATGTFSRLTTAANVTSVQWTRDGDRIIYSAGSESRATVWSQPVSVASAPAVIAQIPYLAPDAELSPDGRSLLVQAEASAGGGSWRVLLVPLDSPRVAHPFLGGDVPRFSPDGRWVAVHTYESGIGEVYVRSFPDPSVKVQVSVGGGEGPSWSADGTRLYYRAGAALLMEARVAAGTGFRVVSRDTLFRALRTGVSQFGEANYDVARDGSRAIVLASQTDVYQLVVVPNWLTEFRQRVRAGRN